MKKFRKIYVEITNICNRNCSFCPETRRTKAFMSKEVFEYVAKQIKPYTDYIYLHVKGEPLIHHELKDILEICNRFNFKVNISTNGTLLKEKMDILKNNNVPKLNVSLHSFEDKDKNELIKYITDIIMCSNELANSGMIIRYKLWNDTESDDTNNKQIIKLLEKMYHFNIENKQYNKDIKLKDNVYLSIKRPFKWPDIHENINKQGTCYGLRNHIAILVDGTVTPCCLDNNGDINLGNILSKDLEYILSQKRTLNIKKGFEQGKCIEELCKRCRFRDNL